MPGGLKQNTPDYREVFQQFMNDEFDVEEYDAEEIFKSKASYAENYNKKQFKSSVKRLVEKVKEQKAKGMFRSL